MTQPSAMRDSSCQNRGDRAVYSAIEASGPVAYALGISNSFEWMWRCYWCPTNSNKRTSH